ncbi:hypothetical protein HAV15_004542 [Penicillium sp. str. |nr:hypothetical protein HAV15_004542 [Penicillium sp. str. \
MGGMQNYGFNNNRGNMMGGMRGGAGMRGGRGGNATGGAPNMMGMPAVTPHGWHGHEPDGWYEPYDGRCHGWRYGRQHADARAQTPDSIIRATTTLPTLNNQPGGAPTQVPEPARCEAQPSRLRTSRASRLVLVMFSQGFLLPSTGL